MSDKIGREMGLRGSCFQISAILSFQQIFSWDGSKDITKVQTKTVDEINTENISMYTNVYVYMQFYVFVFVRGELSQQKYQIFRR